MTYWQTHATGPEAGRTIAPVIGALLEPYQALAADPPSLADAFAHVESIYATLSALWELQIAGGGPAYSQERMHRLMRGVGATLQALCRRVLLGDASHPWQRGVTELRVAVGDSLALLHEWTSTRVGQLMQDWTPGATAISKHVWAGPAFHDAALGVFVGHLEDARAVADLEAELRMEVAADHADAIESAFSAVRSVDLTQVSVHPTLQTACTCANCTYLCCTFGPMHGAATWSAGAFHVAADMRYFSLLLRLVSSRARTGSAAL